MTCVVSGEGRVWVRQASERVVCVVGMSARMSYPANRVVLALI